MSESQIRGLLLEEAVLHLLRSAGYSPIYGKGSDNTLEQEGNSLFVRGRGERHQIDAIADYRVQPPFSNSQRLLLEAKFYDHRQVGLNVIRNAVGVLNDVAQFFVAPPGHLGEKTSLSLSIRSGFGHQIHTSLAAIRLRSRCISNTIRLITIF